MNKEITKEDVNNWLKENKDQTYDEFVQEYIDTVVLLNKIENKSIKLLEKSKRYEEVLNEIREYIDNNSHYYSIDDGSVGFVIEEEKEETFCKDILQIIDKVLGEDEK